MCPPGMMPDKKKPIVPHTNPRRKLRSRILPSTGSCCTPVANDINAPTEALPYVLRSNSSSARQKQSGGDALISSWPLPPIEAHSDQPTKPDEVIRVSFHFGKREVISKIDGLLGRKRDMASPGCGYVDLRWQSTHFYRSLDPR